MEWGLSERILSQCCMLPQRWGILVVWKAVGRTRVHLHCHVYLGLVECSWNKSLSFSYFSHFNLHHMMVSVHEWGSSLIKLNCRTCILCVLATWQVFSTPDQVRFCLRYGLWNACRVKTGFLAPNVLLCNSDSCVTQGWKALDPWSQERKQQSCPGAFNLGNQGTQPKAFVEFQLIHKTFYCIWFLSDKLWLALAFATGHCFYYSPVCISSLKLPSLNLPKSGMGQVGICHGGRLNASGTWDDTVSRARC